MPDGFRCGSGMEPELSRVGAVRANYEAQFNDTIAGRRVGLRVILVGRLSLGLISGSN